MKTKTCCFAGHRHLPQNRAEKIIKRLNDELETLMRQGVKDFISGGVPGFDMLAASLVIVKRELGRDVRLVFALPCKNQETCWPDEQARLYQKLLGEADQIRYVSGEYSLGCIKKRNRYMVDQSAYCICCLPQNKGGAFQTVRYARKGPESD